MKKPYKYGGKAVPGMFKAQEGWGPDSFKDFMITPPPPQERSWLGNIGTRIANIFRPSHKDMSPHIKGQLLNPRVPNFPIDPRGGGMINPDVSFGNTTSTQLEQGIVPRETGIRKRGGRMKRGGSVGPNGML